MFDVCCVGILVADILVKPVDSFPEKGLLKLVDSIELFTGGNAMTAAINLSKLGLSASIFGKVGNDYWGNFLRETLKKHNVNEAGIAVSDKKQTSVSVALSSDDGERTFLHTTGANSVFGIKDIDWSIIEKSRIVFITGTFLLTRFDGKETVEFLKKCKELGKLTALDVCWDSSGHWSGLSKDAMPYIDYFLPSAQEALKIADCDAIESAAKKFLMQGAKNVVIKLGKNGCYAQEGSNESGEYYKTYSNIKPVDTTGAGDSFCSGFLAAIAKGKSFKDCVCFANAAGTQCIMEKGATSGMKCFAEIEKFMEDNKNAIQ